MLDIPGISVNINSQKDKGVFGAIRGILCLFLYYFRLHMHWGLKRIGSWHIHDS